MLQWSSPWPQLGVGFVAATLLTVLVASAAAVVAVREARTALRLEPIDLVADPAKLRERGPAVDGMFELGWTGRVQLSCSVLRRCPGEAELSYDSEAHDLSFEQLADGDFVARWILYTGDYFLDPARCARLRVVELPRRPWRAASAAMTASVVLLGWLVLLRRSRRQRAGGRDAARDDGEQAGT